MYFNNSGIKNDSRELLTDAHVENGNKDNFDQALYMVSKEVIKPEHTDPNKGQDFLPNDEDGFVHFIQSHSAQPSCQSYSHIRDAQQLAFEMGMIERYFTCLNESRVIQLSTKDLDNCMNAPDYTLSNGGECMATKINRTVMINGEKKWIHANTEQEYADKLLKSAGYASNTNGKHIFKEYANNWFDIYSKPNVETATATTYQRQLNLHLNPFFGEMAIEEISVDDVQRFFNAMSGSKSTKYKAKTVLNMILNAALEDGLIQYNPLKSQRLKITGKASVFTEPYSVDQMKYLIKKLDDIKNPNDKTYLAIQALHPLRLEEVLGLKWGDIDINSKQIHIRRAVTHPTRNRPEIKDTKTDASRRSITLSQITEKYLFLGDKDSFVLGGGKPYSYQQVKRMCQRIKADTGFDENITPIRFRTTVLTDIYEATKDVKAAQAAAGHTTSAMTLKHYIKGRGTSTKTAEAIDQMYKP